MLRRLLRRVVRSMRLLGYEDPALPELPPDQPRQDGETYTQLHHDWGTDLHRRLRRGARVPPDAAGGHHDLRPGDGCGGEAVRRHPAGRRPGVLPARHLRLPDRPHPRDGGRAGAQRRRGRVPPADERAAPARQGTTRRPRRDSTATPRRTARSRTPWGRWFTGYDTVTDEGSVRGIVAGWRSRARRGPGELVEIVLDRTPFYAEGGGQLADRGRDRARERRGWGPTSSRRSPASSHPRARAGGRGHARPGGRRSSTSSADARSLARTPPRTWCTRRSAGVRRDRHAGGSENSPGRFRFDFSATGAVPVSVMADVEARVNDVVLDDLAVHAG